MRKLVSQQSIKAISGEIADLQLSPEVIEGHLENLITLLEGIDRLRALPLKEIEPAMIFSPIED